MTLEGSFSATSTSRNPESAEAPFGRNVEMVIKVMRHGQRTPEGALTEAGKQGIRERAQQSGLVGEDFDAVKAYGSSVGERKGVGKRALESASIYADEISENDALTTRVNDLLSYEELITPLPYDHDAIVESNLPKDFLSLSQEEQAAAMIKAQSEAAWEELSMTTPEAMAYRKESAAAHAHALNHYRKMAKRLKSGSRVLLTLGTHGTMIEYLLMEAIIQTDENGKESVGTNDVEDFGGVFNTSDAYTVTVETDANGAEKVLRLTFDQGDKQANEYRLDIHKLDELDELYTRLHNGKK